MAIGNVIRMAGPKLLNFLKGDLNNAQLLGRLAPDIAFAGVNMAMTPGNIGEKATAGITDLAMSGLTGLAAGNAARRLGASQNAAGYVDMAASLAGAYGAYPVSTAITRGVDKLTGGPGMTTYEKMAQEDQQAYAAQIQQATLEKLGLLPGVNPQYVSDPYLAQLGMG